MRDLYENTSNYNGDKYLITRPARGTCEWFLNDKKYEEWRSKQRPSLLWVAADPGCGKSVLSSFLVDELRNPKSKSAFSGSVCFFFFKDDDARRKSATSALCALLHQLFDAKKSLIQCAKIEFQKKGHRFTEELQSLWNTLTAAAEKDCGNIICILDGLDGCEKSSGELLIDHLVLFYSESKSQTPKSFLKFLVTSRPYSWIENKFHELSEVRLTATDSISEDIKAVVSDRVKSIASKRGIKETSRILSLENRLVSNADGTFLWVDLMLKMLEESVETSEKTFTDILEKPPRGLDSVYEKILERCHDRSKARYILQIIVAAFRPLTLTEMKVALATKPNHKSIDDLRPYIYSNIESSLKQLCGLFVRVENSKIYLIHQTAKEFLMRQPDELWPENRSEGNAPDGLGRPLLESAHHVHTNPPNISSWMHTLDSIESNGVFAEICISYLLFSEFENKSPDISKDLDFLAYASTHWASHFRGAKIGEDSVLLESALEVCDTQSPRFVTWFRTYWKTQTSPCPTLWDDLMVGSYFGLGNIVQLLLKKGKDITAKDDAGATALHLAALGGHDTVVRLLLKKRADLRARDDNGLTALHHAIRNGHKKAVKLLLESGAKVDATALDRGSNVHFDKWYVANGSNRAVLEGGMAALQWAVRQDYQEIVEQLLVKGADVDAVPVDGGPTVQITELFVGGGAFDATIQNGGSIMQIEKLHLDQGSVAITTENGITALQWAVRNGYQEMARLLLSKAVGKRTENGMSAVHWAAWSWYQKMVRLLEGRANTKTKAVDGGPIMQITELFVGGGAFGATIQNGGSVMQIQKLHLARGSVTITTENGISAMHWAARNGHQEVVRLLEGKANTKTKAMDGGPIMQITELFVGGAFGATIQNGGSVMQIEKLHLDKGTVTITTKSEITTTNVDNGPRVQLSELFVGGGAFDAMIQNGGSVMQIEKLHLGRGTVTITTESETNTTMGGGPRVQLSELFIGTGAFDAKLQNGGSVMQIEKLHLDRGTATVTTESEINITTADSGPRLQITELFINTGVFDAKLQNGGSVMQIEKLHLDRGTVRITTLSGITTLRWAARNGYQEMARLLEGRANTKTTAVDSGPRVHIRKLFVREGSFDATIENGGANIWVEEVCIVGNQEVRRAHSFSSTFLTLCLLLVIAHLKSNGF